MRAGSLRSRVVIQTLSSTYDDYGELSNAWLTGDTVWASVIPVGGTEKNIANELVGVVTHVVKMRYRDLAMAASGVQVQTTNPNLMVAGNTLTMKDGNGDSHTFVADTDFAIVTEGTTAEAAVVTAQNLSDAINAAGGGQVFESIRVQSGHPWRLTLRQLIRGSGGNYTPTETGDGWNVLTGGWTTAGADGLAAENRLLFGSQILQIESIRNWQERGIFLELLCKEVTT